MNLPSFFLPLSAFLQSRLVLVSDPCRQGSHPFEFEKVSQRCPRSVLQERPTRRGGSHFYQPVYLSNILCRRTHVCRPSSRQSSTVTRRGHRSINGPAEHHTSVARASQPASHSSRSGGPSTLEWDSQPVWYGLPCSADRLASCTLAFTRSSSWLLSSRTKTSSGLI